MADITRTQWYGLAEEQRTDVWVARTTQHFVVRLDQAKSQRDSVRACQLRAVELARTGQRSQTATYRKDSAFVLLRVSKEHPTDGSGESIDFLHRFLQRLEAKKMWVVVYGMGSRGERECLFNPIPSGVFPFPFPIPGLAWFYSHSPPIHIGYSHSLPLPFPHY